MNVYVLVQNGNDLDLDPDPARKIESRQKAQV
jgi:hypothetical protein